MVVMKYFKGKLQLLVSIIFIMSNVIGCGVKDQALFGEENNKSKAVTSVSKAPESSTTNTEISSTNPEISEDTSKGPESKSGPAPIIQKPSDDDTRPRPDYMNQIVYYAAYSNLYHYDKECKNFKRGVEVLSGKLSEAIHLGHNVPCKVCIPQY